MLEPHAGVQLIWNFAGGTAATGIGSLKGEEAGPSGVCGRNKLGIRSMTLGGSYDGIGASGYNAATGKATVRVPLN